MKILKNAVASSPHLGEAPGKKNQPSLFSTTENAISSLALCILVFSFIASTRPESRSLFQEDLRRNFLYSHMTRKLTTRLFGQNQTSWTTKTPQERAGIFSQELESKDAEVSIAARSMLSKLLPETPENRQTVAGKKIGELESHLLSNLTAPQLAHPATISLRNLLLLAKAEEPPVAAIANSLRLLCRSDFIYRRTDTKELNQLQFPLFKIDEEHRSQSYSPPLREAKPGVLDLIETLAKMGIEREPENGYFRCMLSSSLFGKHMDRQALEALRTASRCAKYDDFVGSLEKGVLKLIHKNSTDLSRIDEYFASCGIFAYQNGVFNHVAELALVHAIRLERNLKANEGLQIRFALLRFGNLIQRKSHRLFEARVGEEISKQGLRGVFELGSRRLYDAEFRRSTEDDCDRFQNSLVLLGSSDLIPEFVSFREAYQKLALSTLRNQRYDPYDDTIYKVWLQINESQIRAVLFSNFVWSLLFTGILFALTLTKASTELTLFALALLYEIGLVFVWRSLWGDWQIHSREFYLEGFRTLGVKELPDMMNFTFATSFPISLIQAVLFPPLVLSSLCIPLVLFFQQFRKTTIERDKPFALLLPKMIRACLIASAIVGILYFALLRIDSRRESVFKKELQNLIINPLSESP